MKSEDRDIVVQQRAAVTKQLAILSNEYRILGERIKQLKKDRMSFDEHLFRRSLHEHNTKKAYEKTLP